MRVKAIVAAILFSLGAGLFQQVQAQASNTCNGRIVIDTIYQTGTGGNNFEYFIHLRNATRQALVVDVHFSGFPLGVTLFSTSLPGIPLGPNATISSLRFGRGTNSQINTGSVARIYDASPGAGATVRLTNCRAG